MALAPSPTKDTKLVLSMSIQMPKQKIRLPRTWQEEMGIWRWAKARGTGEGISGQGAGAGAGAGLGSHVATHEEEEVENEEEVFDEAEAAVLGRHLHLRGVGSPWEGQKRRGVGPGGDEQKDRSCERQRGRKEEHRERGSLPAPPAPPPAVEPHPLPLQARWLSGLFLRLPASLTCPTGTHTCTGGALEFLGTKDTLGTPSQVSMVQAGGPLSSLHPPTLGTRTPGQPWTAADLTDTLTSLPAKLCRLCISLCPHPHPFPALSLSSSLFWVSVPFCLGLCPSLPSLPQKPPRNPPHPASISSLSLAPSLCRPVLSLLMRPTLLWAPSQSLHPVLGNKCRAWCSRMLGQGLGTWGK